MSVQIRQQFPHFRSTGFGLVEIMVGLAIGMIATLVIVQVASTFEGQKRTTTGGADAQSAGNIAIYSMQRQVQMAGYGLPIFSTQSQVLSCANPPLLDLDLDGDPEAEVGIRPIEIIDGGNGSDAIIVRWGTTGLGGMPLLYAGGPPDNTPSCAKGDMVLLGNGAECRMTTVTAAAPQTLAFKDSWPAYNGIFACLGRWNARRYSVDANASLIEEMDVFLVEDEDAGDPVLRQNSEQVISGVVSMKAQYGVSDVPRNNQVTQYVDAVEPDWAGDEMPVANRNRIKAVRVALVVRSGTLESENVTEACSSRTEPNPTGLCSWAGTEVNPAPEIDLSADPNWQRYRYRVFDTVIPLRNMIWSVDKL